MLVNYYGISISLSTNIEDFKQFAQTNYQLFLTEKLPPQSDAQITIEFRSDFPDASFNQCKSTFSYIGEGTYFKENQIYHENEFGFKIILTLEGALSISIRAYHFDLNNTNLAEEEILRNYQRCMRWCIHFPLFYLLNKAKGLNILHGSACNYREKTLIFSGLNKVGKTTTMLKFAKEDPTSYIISDNFCLFNETTIFPFPEVLRLSHDSLSHFSISPKGLRRVYNKFHISPSESKSKIFSPDFFFIVSVSKMWSFEEVDKKQAAKIVAAMSDYLKEFPAYSFYAALALFDSDYPNWSSSAIEQWEKCRFFKISYDQNWDLDGVYHQIASVIFPQALQERTR